MALTEDEVDRILEKATYLQESIALLEDKQSIDKQTYEADRETQAVVEREFHTAIEACSDIAGILVSAHGEEMAASYAGRFGQLSDLDICAPELATKMQEAAGFRNILAHRYGSEIDDDLVYRHLQEDVKILKQFLRAVREFAFES